MSSREIDEGIADIESNGTNAAAEDQEPVENLDCEDMIQEFEEKLILAEKDRKRKEKLRQGGRGLKPPFSDLLVISDESEAGTSTKQLRRAELEIYLEKAELTKNIVKVVGEEEKVKENSVSEEKVKETSVSKEIVIENSVLKVKVEKDSVSEEKVKPEEMANIDVSETIPDVKIPEKIIGASDASGQLMFLLKWKGVADLWAHYISLFSRV